MINKTIKAVGNPARACIIDLLHGGQELSVTELEEQIGLSQSALSQHLAILRDIELVKTRREKQTIFYRINEDCDMEVDNFIISLLALASRNGSYFWDKQTQTYAQEK